MSAPRRRPTAFVRLGRVRGAPILVAPSWLLISVLLIFFYGPLIQAFADGIGDGVAYLSAAAFTVLFAACVVAHEAARARMCAGLGYPVTRVVLFFLGGICEIEGDARRPRDEFLMAVTGPVLSLAIAGVAFTGSLTVDPSALLGVLLLLLAWSNLVVAAFNLLPGLPMAGGRIVRSVAWACGAGESTATRIAAWSGRVVALGVAATGLALNMTLAQSDGFTAALLSFAIAAYLWMGASHALKTAALMERLPNVRVRDLLRPGLLVPGDLSVAEALRRVAEGHARGLVLLDAAERPTAIVDELLISAVPPDRRPWTPVSEVARPLDPGRTVPADLDANALLDHMKHNPAGEYLAVDGEGAPAGIIATVDFAQLLRGSA